MTTFALAALLLTARRQSAGVTLETGLLPAEKVIARLSAEANVSLRVSPSLARYPLLLRLHNHPTDDVLRRIAAVIGGEWRKDGDGFLLGSVRVDNVLDARRIAAVEAGLSALEAQTKNVVFDEKFAAAQRKAAKEMSDRMMSMMTSGGDFDMTKAITSGPVAETPASQAVAPLLRKIGAKTLGALRPNERAVFALQPTAMQSALPAGSGEIVHRFLVSTQTLRQALKNTADGQEGADPLSMMVGEGPVNPDAMTNALLTITPSDEMLTVTIAAYDAEGKAIATGFAIAPIVRPAPAVVLAPEEEKPLSFTPLALEWGAKYKAASEAGLNVQGGVGMNSFSFSTGANQSRNAALAKPASGDLHALLLDPVGQEPGASLLDPIAAALPGDVVATVPDDGLYVLASIPAANATTTKAIAELAANLRFAVTRENGTITISAATVGRLRSAYADRAALRELARKVDAQGYPRLEDLAAYAVAQRTPGGAAALAKPILSLLGSASSLIFSGGDVVTDFDALRVWGLLPAGSRERLASGRGVPFADLVPDARESVARDLFASARPFGTADATMNIGDFSSLTSGAYSDERTVRFAGGLPGDGYLSAETKTDDTYRMRDSATGRVVFGGAEQLGFVRGAQKIPFLSAIAGNGNFDAFTPAKSTTVSLKFVYGKNAALEHELRDDQVSGDAVLTYDKLPKEFRDKAEEIAKFPDEFMSQNRGKINP